jgi:carbamoyl-phosphate synthase small subunit
VKNLITGHCEITSQNHGFAVEMEKLMQHPDLILSHQNLNDQTVEGIRLKNGQGFSVQYHPEANPGPHDSRYLFRQFKELIG